MVRSLITEEEAMQGADWDWTVPSKTGTGDWYSWFTWSGTGGYVDPNHPAVTPSSINPALINWYSYNINDPYYQKRSPAPYARVFLGATSVTMKQGPGIHSQVEFYARQGSNGQGPCAVIRPPACLGTGGRSASSARSRASAVARRLRSRRRVGKTIVQRSASGRPIHGTSRNDEIRAKHSHHKIRAGAGDDQVLTGRKPDRIHGGTGNDELTSFRGNDWLRGGTGNDVLQGGSGSDVSIGGSGSDSLFDASGQDHMFAGSGNDRIVVRDQHDSAPDVVDCGPGRDMVIADPSDRIMLTTGATVPAGAFTAGHTPAHSTCELVYSSVHMPPRNPPSIGEHAGRPRGSPEPLWPVLDH